MDPVNPQYIKMSSSLQQEKRTEKKTYKTWQKNDQIFFKRVIKKVDILLLLKMYQFNQNKKHKFYNDFKWGLGGLNLCIATPQKKTL